MDDKAIIATKELTKRFGGLTAVDAVDLDIQEGKITAIVGGNGAGKSTFIKMISGVYQPTSGQVFYDGKPLPVGDPLAVRNLGIETIYQDLSLIELLDVPDNIFLGREKYRKMMGFRILDKEFMLQESRRIMDELKIRIPSLSLSTGSLSGGQRQAVSIGRAIYWNAKVIIMDEPTAALGIQEKSKVKELILDLKSQGVTIIVISHEMSDVFEICDNIVVFFQGQCVGNKEKEKTTIDEIAKLIITGQGLN